MLTMLKKVINLKFLSNAQTLMNGFERNWKKDRYYSLNVRETY